MAVAVIGTEHFFLHWNSYNRLRIHYLTMMRFIEIVFASVLVHFVIGDYGIFGKFVYTFLLKYRKRKQMYD